MRIILNVLTAPPQRHEVLLKDGEPYVVGRVAGNHLAIPLDVRMSGKHFALELREESVWIADRESTNGTMVNGQWTKEVSLHHGDQIFAGATHFQVEFVEAECRGDQSSDANAGNANVSDAKATGLNRIPRQHHARPPESVPIPQQGPTDGDIAGAEQEVTVRSRVAPAPVISLSAVEAKDLEFAVLSPPVLPAGGKCKLQFWIFQASLRRQVLGMAEQLRDWSESEATSQQDVFFDSDIAVLFDLPGCTSLPRYGVFHWDGKMGYFVCEIEIPDSVGGGIREGVANLYSAGIQIARLEFEFKLGNQAGNAQSNELLPLAIDAHLIRRAFCAFAPEDKPFVDAWLSTVRQLGIEAVYDWQDTRDEASWQLELADVLQTNDLCCLFWSTHARESEWVNREWKLARAMMGEDFVFPVPLHDSSSCPLPSSLVTTPRRADILTLSQGFAELHGRFA